jgi:hypothetical protein
LLVAAQVVGDLEKVRIANAHRLRILTATGPDSDGVERGFGLPTTHPDVQRLAGIVQALEDLEHQAVLALQRRMRAHALGPWVKAQRGLGDKQMARLLAAIGDPYWHVEGRPRTVSELWAYCGLHVLDGAAPHHRRGEQSNWSTHAKTRAYLVAESCLKQLSKECKVSGDQVTHDAHCGIVTRITHGPECTCSPYRVTYDARRAVTDVTHADWTPGHLHHDALRVSAKAILRDLWIEGRRLHGEGSNALHVTRV